MLPLPGPAVINLPRPLALTNAAASVTAAAGSNATAAAGSSAAGSTQLQQQQQQLAQPWDAWVPVCLVPHPAVGSRGVASRTTAAAATEGGGMDQHGAAADAVAAAAASAGVLLRGCVRQQRGTVLYLQAHGDESD
jgi:hypothetical protein